MDLTQVLFVSLFTILLFDEGGCLPTDQKELRAVKEKLESLKLLNKQIENEVTAFGEQDDCVTVEPKTSTSVPIIACPNPWSSYQANCYHIHDDCPRNWTNAQDVCEKEGGYLVSLENYEENKFVKTGLSLSTENAYHIGAYRNKGSSTWYWNKGDLGSIAVSYRNWNRREPNNAGGVEYAATLKFQDGNWGWNDADGSLLEPFICEAPSHAVLAGCDSNPCLNGGSCFASTEGGSGYGSGYGPNQLPYFDDEDRMLNTEDYQCECQSGYIGLQCEFEVNADWNKWSTFEYRVVDNCGKNRDDAAELCKSMGGFLLSIHCNEEFEFVVGVLNKRKDLVGGYGRHTSWWIGGKAVSDGWERTWVWEEGETDVPMDFILWNHGEPNNFAGREDVVELRYYDNPSSRFKMNDITGTATSPFICKRPVKK